MSEDRPVDRIALPPVLREGAPAAVLAALSGARAVGGAVRDTLAGLDVQDVDMAAPYPPLEISDRLRAAGLKVFDTGLAHGTVTAVLDHQPVEVTALRRDVVTDGRHAEVEWTTDWREDAARRDFTINAMSLAPDGSLFDYFGGRDDLARGVVRFVGDPATRLREDFLRVLRFFRFHTRYGRGAPDAAAVAAIREAVPGLARLSVERVWMELKRILVAPDPIPALELMSNAGVLAAVLPEGFDLAAVQRLKHINAPVEPLLRLAASLPAGSDAWRLANRLKMSTEERSLLGVLQTEHSLARRGAPQPGVDLTDRGARRSLFHAEQNVGAERARDLALWQSFIVQSEDSVRPPKIWNDYRIHIQTLDIPALPIAGRDVLAGGMQAGPQVGAVLTAVRTWWLDGGCTADRETCLDELRRLIATHKNNGGAGPGG